MKPTLTVLLLLLFVIQPTTGSASTATTIEAEQVGFVLTPQGRLRLTMTVRPTATGYPVESSKQTLIFVPRLTDALGHEADFPAVALMQPQAYKHYVRSAHRNHPAREAVLQLRAGHTRDAYEYNCSIGYAEWMAGATLQLITIDTRCCQATVARKDTLVASAGLVQFAERVSGGVHDAILKKKYEAFIDFPVNQTYIDENYHSNARELRRLEQNISEVMNDSTLAIHGVTFHGYASPEGSYDNNERLAQGRTEVMRQHVIRRLQLPDSLVHATYTTENWEGFRRYVDESSLPQRQQMLDIIDDSSLPPDPKLLRLQQRFPAEMARIVQNVFPRLRYTEYTISYSSVQKGEGPVLVRDTVRIMPTGPDQPDITEQIPMWMPVLALKTNLLFDAALCPNLEVEVPLGMSRWSIMAEWWTPWYRWDGPNKRNLAYELLTLGAELRLWLNRRCHTCRSVLTGAFIGIYGAGGKYDVEYNKTTHEGWQGEFTSFGLTAGYSVPLAPHWNLELSLSGGYIGGPQRKYIGMFNNEHLIWQRNQNLRFIGPTKAKVSIAWIIGRPYGRKAHSKKGGASWQ
jgi:hypothetical protein